MAVCVTVMGRAFHSCAGSSDSAVSVHDFRQNLFSARYPCLRSSVGIVVFWTFTTGKRSAIALLPAWARKAHAWDAFLSTISSGAEQGGFERGGLHPALFGFLAKKNRKR